MDFTKIKTLLSEAFDHAGHIEQELANRDINAKVSGETVKVHKDNVAKAKNIVKKLGVPHKVIPGLNEGEELTEQFLEEMTDDDFESVVENYEQLDELSKSTLASYVKKASQSATGLATNAMHHKNISNQWSDTAKSHKDRGDKSAARIASKSSDAFNKYSFDATNKQVKRLKGVASAADKLAK